MAKTARRPGHAGLDVRRVEWTEGTSGLKMKPKCINRFEWRNRETLTRSHIMGRQIARNAQCAGGKDARRSESRHVMWRTGILNLSHSKES